MTGEMPPQGLLTATGFAAREAARTLRVGTTSSEALRADAGYQVGGPRFGIGSL